MLNEAGQKVSNDVASSIMKSGEGTED